MLKADCSAVGRHDVGRTVLILFAGIAEVDRALILHRTSTGRPAGTKRGVRFGRPIDWTPPRKLEP